MQNEKEKDDDLTAIFQQGFNDGYMLREQMPELAQSLERSLADIHTEYSSAFKDGMNQYDIENDKGLMLDWKMDQDRDHDDFTPDKDADKDRDEIEPEMD